MTRPLLVSLALLLASAAAACDRSRGESHDSSATPGSGAAGTGAAGSGAPATDAVADAEAPPPVLRDPRAPSFDPQLAARGAELYGQYCSLCHGPSGEGYAADNANALNNQNFLAIADDTFLRTAILHGRPGTPMSAWGTQSAGPLNTEDANAIIALLRSWQTVPSIDVRSQHFHGSPIRGRAVYQQHCASCHGDQGQGVTAVSLANPWFLNTASEGYLAYSILFGRPGTPMPAFERTLSQNEVNDVVSYIRGWTRPIDQGGPDGFEPDYGRAVINPDGEPATFTLREDRFVAVDDVKAALDAGKSLILIDARATSDYLDSHISGAISVPFYNIERAIAALPRDRYVIAYCGCPHAASGRVVDALREAGFPMTAVLDEGYYVWKQREYPLSSGVP